MTDANVGWDGDDPTDLADTIEELEAALEQHLKEAMETAILLVEGTAKRLVPVDTGRLRSSIATEVQQIASNVLRAHIGTNVEYAEAIEFGTDPHTITADSAEALHWTEGGEDVFAQSVEHPGTDPQSFIGDAIETHIDDIEELLVGAIEDAVDEVS